MKNKYTICNSIPVGKVGTVVPGSEEGPLYDVAVNGTVDDFPVVALGRQKVASGYG